MKDMKLSGPTEGKFKQIETVINRVVRTQNAAKTIIERPLSVISHYVVESPDDGVLFLGGLFEGKVRKVLFSVQEIEGKDSPRYLCSVGNELLMHQASVVSKKKMVMLNVDIDVSDGDLIKLEMTTIGTKIRNVVMTALVEFDKKLVSKLEFDTNSLLDKLEIIENERV